MSLNEIQAQQVMLVRAIEQAQDTTNFWSKDDAKDATRETNEINASFEQFVARRAKWVLNNIKKNKSAPKIDLSISHLPTIAGWLMIAAALIIGFVTDHLISDRRVNILEYPLIVLILYNFGIYIAILAIGIGKLFSSNGKSGGILTKVIDAMGRWSLRGVIKTTDGKEGPWIENFKDDWCSISASLNLHRLYLIMHAASMSFAAGMLGGLYARGLFKEYRAGWESTWCASGDCIHAIATVVLTPGALLWNMKIPDAVHIAGLRFPESTGEIAGDWIHLYAGTILVCIIIPRFLLACWSGISKWRLQRSFFKPIGPYFVSLKAIREGKPVDVLVIPFRYELTPQVKSDLQRQLERVYGIEVTISVKAPVKMGEDTKDWKMALGKESHIAVFVIFNIIATPESDDHGQLLKRLRKEVPGEVSVIPIVDTGPAPPEWDRDRLMVRSKLWRHELDHLGFEPLLLNLKTPDAEDIQKRLEDRLSDDG